MGRQVVIKRIFDFILSFTGLIVLSPMIVIIAGLVWTTSKGGIFYTQDRIGRYRIPFKMIKFRSMTVGADKNGPLITAEGDGRVTKIGRFLRRTKLDELPELLNVLKGDMSLVGPRPPTPKFIEYYTDKWDKVLVVRPGITDYATLQFRDEESVLKDAVDVEKTYIDVILPVKLNLALHYIGSRNFCLDLKILIMTVWGISVGRFFATFFLCFLHIISFLIIYRSRREGVKSPFDLLS